MGEILGALLPGLTVLILACHDDDFVISCGCTIQWLLAVKAKVYVAVLSEQGTQRASQAVAAASRLGLPLSNLFLGQRIPDGQFLENRMTLQAALNALLDLLQPALAFSHGPGDTHPDHDIMGREVRQVFRYLLALLFYPIDKPVAEDWFRPTLFLDAEPYLERTLKVLAECFPTERAKMYCDPETQRSTRRKWGQQAGLEYAEAFALERAILTSQPWQQKPQNGGKVEIKVVESEERSVGTLYLSGERWMELRLESVGLIRADQWQAQAQPQTFKLAA